MLTSEITAQHAQQLRSPEIIRNDIMLLIHLKLEAAHTGNDVRAATSLLSTFQQDSVIIFNIRNFWPSVNSSTNNFQDLLLKMNYAALVYTYPISAGEYTEGVWHQIPSPLTETAWYVSGHVDILPQESRESFTAPDSVLQDPIGCYSGADQDMLFNSDTADFWWSGVFSTTWDLNLGQGEPFNEEVIDQQWTERFSLTYNSDLNQDLLSHDQTVNQQWSDAFENEWHSCLNVLMNEQSVLLNYSVTLQPFDYITERIWLPLSTVKVLTDHSRKMMLTWSGISS